ncbi:MAG: sugar ABC transporter permease [Firmicutes bacterium]|nr:sugar ABC transporter permease [Bacillota bacterium]
MRFRTIYYLPSVLPVIATVYLWRWMFNPNGGLLNRLLGWFGLDTSNLLWIYGQHTAKPSLVLMSLWGIGGGMVIYLAALQGVPTHLYEAAQLDGAGVLARFWHVTVPMISPVIFFNLITNMIGAFQTFTQVYLLTDGPGGPGGPLNATLMYMMYLYRQAFVNFRLGYGAAMAWILFAIIMVLTLLNLMGGKHWVFYQGEREDS